MNPNDMIAPTDLKDRYKAACERIRYLEAILKNIKDRMRHRMYPTVLDEEVYRMAKQALEGGDDGTA